MNQLDQELIAELKMVLEDEFTDLIRAFLDDSAERTQALKLALAAADYQGMAHTAHSFKGSASNLGAQPLADFCMALEQAAQYQDHEQCQRLVQEVDSAQQQACQQLATEI